MVVIPLIHSTPDERKQNDDRNRYSQQPKQNSASHGVALSKFESTQVRVNRERAVLWCSFGIG
jgi:hypothetical protein